MKIVFLRLSHECSMNQVRKARMKGKQKNNFHKTIKFI